MKIRRKYLPKVLLGWMVLSTLPFCFNNTDEPVNFLAKAHAADITIPSGTTSTQTDTTLSDATIENYGLLETAGTVTFYNETVKDLTSAGTTGAITIGSTSTLLTTGTTSISGGTLTNNGTLEVKDGTTNLHEISIINNSAIGTIAIDAGSRLLTTGTTSIVYNTLNNDTGASFTNSGTLTNNTGATFTNNGELNNTGTIKINGGSFTSQGNIQNSAQLKVDGGTVTVSGNTLQNNSTGTITVSNGNLNITDSGSLLNSNQLKIANTGTLTVNGGSLTNTHSMTSVGTIEVSGGALQVVSGLFGNATQLMVDGGAVTMSGGSLTNYSTGTISVSSGSLDVSGGTLNNFNQLQVDGGTATLSGGTLYNDSTGIISISSGNLDINAGTLSNSNQLTVDGGTVTVSGGSLTNYSTGTITVSSGSLNVNSGTLDNENKLDVDSGGTLAVNGGTLTNDGTITVNATGIMNVTGGTISGNAITSMGTINVNGGTLNTDLNISGTSSQAATLNVTSGMLYGNTNIGSYGTMAANGGTIYGDITVENNGILTVNGPAIIAGPTKIYGDMTVNAGIVGTADIETSGELVVNGGIVYSTTIDGGTLSITGGTVSNITNNNGSLYVSGGMILPVQNLTITKQTGGATFIISTDAAQNLSNKISILDSTSSGANTILVNYDPSFGTGSFVTGTAVFAETTSKAVTFTAAATDYGARRYLPIVNVGSDGLTWTITGFTIDGKNGGASETVYSGLDTAVGTMALWRSENNNLTRRLGELRNAKENTGEWTRIYRGEQKIAGLNGRETSQQYTAIQGGYDSKHESKDGTWFTGYTVGYLHADSALNRGKSGASSTTLGAYASWLGDKGHYLDLIAKQGRLRSDYYSYLNNASNTKVTGNYSNWGTSLSAEYGKRTSQQNGWYLEPQAEINLTHITPASYTTSDNTSVHNQRVTSVIGRIGLAIGKEQKKNSFYFKTSLAKEFNANPSITMSDVSLGQNLKDTWLEFDLGWNAAYDHNVSSYLELSKTTGGIVNTSWQVNMGIRKSF